MKLLDYSFSRPDPATIVANGFGGVLRYLSSAGGGKNLSADERDALRAHGLAIGLVYESYALRANEGHDAGVQDAQVALSQANGLGYPQDLPIYFAVDWDATPEQQVNIDAYLNGAKTVLGDRVGLYAGYWVIKRCFDNSVIKWGWQTYAWSGGNWDDRAQLRQEANGQWGGSVDFDEDMAGTAGLWTVDQPVVLQTTPSPQPTTTHAYTIKAGDTFWGLEQANGWTHGTLQNINPGVDPTKLGIGQQINVPGNPSPAPVIQAPAGTTHAIQSGDTFWGLETANGWAHGTLQNMNPGVNPTTLQVGQIINIPGSAIASPAQHTYGHHTIVAGDTFWGIANANGWSADTLEQLNPNVSPTALQIGQVIVTP